jgi:hypothetical protein
MAGMAMASVTLAAASFNGVDANPVVSKAVATASGGPFLVAAMGFAAFLMAAGLLTVRTGVFARWTGIVALIGAVCFLITFLTVIDGMTDGSVFGYAYSCVSRATGVTCTVARGAAKGKGFRIAKSGITRVVQPKPSPVTTEFYSVPGWHCLMFSSGVSCENVTRGWEADLSPSGGVTICTAGTDTCHTGASTGQGIPTIKVGQQVTVQPFRCTYATNGLTCAVIKTGVGFLLTTSGATRVG